MLARGLTDPGFVRRLNHEYRKNGWWTRIADDPDLFVAIRQNYLNVYYRGASLMMLTHQAGKLVGKSHFKYLVRNELDANAYISSIDGQFALNDIGATGFLFDSYDHIEGMKRTASLYAGDEKKGVDAIRRANKNVLDVEVAFASGNPLTVPGSKVPRVDLMAVAETSDGVELVFVEAKLFNNKEVRSKGNAPVPVLEQIQRYERELQRQETDILMAYHQACENLRDLQGTGLDRQRDAALTFLNARTRSVSKKVRLAVFGFDDDQKHGKRWEPHLKRLTDALDPWLLIRGNPEGLTIR